MSGGLRIIPDAVVKPESMFDRARQRMVQLLAFMGLAKAGLTPDLTRVRDMHPHHCGPVGNRGATMRGNRYCTNNNGPGVAKSYLARRGSGLLMQHEIEFLRNGNPKGSYTCHRAT